MRTRSRSRTTSVDAVFVGEAFHWFANAEVLREIARVLRPRGVLAILFNQTRRRLRAEVAEGVLGRLPRRRDREAAGADGENGSLACAVPRPVRAAHRGELPESGRARPRGRSCAGGLVEHDRRASRAGTHGLLARLGELVPEEVYRHPLRTDSTGPGFARLGAIQKEVEQCRISTRFSRVRATRSPCAVSTASRSSRRA